MPIHISDELYKALEESDRFIHDVWTTFAEAAEETTDRIMMENERRTHMVKGAKAKDKVNSREEDWLESLQGLAVVIAEKVAPETYGARRLHRGTAVTAEPVFELTRVESGRIDGRSIFIGTYYQCAAYLAGVFEGACAATRRW